MKLLAAVVVILHGAPAVFTQHPLADLLNTTFEARVTRVSDGDTFDVIPADESRAIRVRLFGVDTPERGEPFFSRARNRTRVLVFDKQVRLTGVSIDSYGRLVARVNVGETDVALVLLSEGLACHFRRYSDDRLQARAEASARTNRLGFWSPGAQPRCARQPVTPPRAIGDATFVGNSRSREFHAPTCRNAGCKYCVRKFSSAEEAIAAGFRPARDCLKGR